MELKEKVRTLKFEDLDLSPEILDGLRDVNLETANDFQESIINAAFGDNDAVINSKSGEGKHASIVISSLERLMKREERTGTHILILTPHPKNSREIDELMWAMGYHAQVESASIDMDGDREEQEESVLDGVPILVANPGRIIEILEDNLFVLRHVDLIIVDEAHEIVSLNLSSKLEEIRKRVISNPQTLLLTDELDKEVKELAERLLEEPEAIGFDGSDGKRNILEEPPSVPQHLKQGYIYVPNRMKITTLMAHLESTPADTCVIFTASKRGTDRLYRVFRKRKMKVTSIHDKLSDEKRDQRFSNFTNGDVQYLLVSDISAADLALDKVTQVINYDVPNDPDEYRYRAALVGSGKATRIVSLVSKQDRSDINQLENELGQAPKELPLPDKVKQKLKKQRNKDKQGKKKKKRGKQKRKQRGSRDKKMELPRPSYDKLSGGRAGDEEDEKSGVVKLIKKIFSSD